MTGMKGPRPRCIVYDEVDESGWTVDVRGWETVRIEFWSDPGAVITPPPVLAGTSTVMVRNTTRPVYSIRMNARLAALEDVVDDRLHTYARREPAIEIEEYDMGSKPRAVKASTKVGEKRGRSNDPFLQLPKPATVNKPKAPTAAEKRRTAAGKRARARATQELIGVRPPAGRRARRA